MSNQYQLHSKQLVDPLTHFLHNYFQSKNHSSIKNLHAYLLRTNLLFEHQNLQTKLISTYTKSLPNQHLKKILPKFLNVMNPKNPSTFNVLISDFSRNGHPFLSLDTFSFMHKNGVFMDSYALCGTLKASVLSGSVGFGKQVHAHLLKSGWSCSVFLGSVLIDLYSKLGMFNDAVDVFDEIPVKNTVCVNALLSGYGDDMLWSDALVLVRKMPMLNLDYDHFTMSATLRACAGLCAIELGKQVHAKLIRILYDFLNDVFLQSSLIEMYGKCGHVEKARRAFDCTREGERDVVLWTAMLGVYGKNGYFEEVIRLYTNMISKGIKPDKISFVTVISACGHAGQVKLGIEYFESMTRDFGLHPEPEHYSCVVDLLCKAGELHTAWKLVNENMSRKDLESCNVSMWGALLNASIDSGNIDLGKMAAKRALEMDPHNAGIYVLLSNLYARLGMWDEIGQLRELMKRKVVDKGVGYSRVDVMS